MSGWTTTRRATIARGAAVALVVLLGVGWFAWSRQSTRARIVEAAAEDARRAVVEGRYEAAEEPLGRWLQLRPNDPDAQALRAEVAVGLERPEEAVEALDRAEALGAPPARLDGLRGILLARSGRPEDAEPLLRRALEQSEAPAPLVAEALADVGLATFRLTTTLEALERWARDAPTDPEPYLRLIDVHRRLGREATEILEDAQQALARDPQRAEARLALAETLAEAGRHRDAAQEYHTYLALEPNDPVALTGAGENALALSEVDEAARLLDRALACAPEHVPALFARAGLDLQGDDAEAALERLDRAVALEPDDAEIHYRRSMALARLGRTEEAAAARAASEQARLDSAALTELRDRLVRNPHDLDAHCEIARWMIDHGHDREGIRWAEKALQQRPDHPATCLLLADYYERSGDYGRANYYRLRARAGSRSVEGEH